MDNILSLPDNSQFLDVLRWMQVRLSNQNVWKMSISVDSTVALALLKDLQAYVRKTEDLRSNPQVNDDLNTLIAVKESPVFQSILNIQDSLR